MVEPEVAYATLDDVMELAEGLVVCVVQRVLERRQRRAEGPRARHDEARARQGAVPAHLVRRRGEDRSSGKGLPFEWGGDFGAPDETAHLRGVRPPGLRAPLSVGGQGVLHEARSGPPGGRARRGRARARGLRRDHRRRPAPRRLRPAARSASRSTSCRRRRSSGTSTSAASAACRTAASAWASSASSAGSAGSSTCARRFRTRACCTASTLALMVPTRNRQQDRSECE